MLKLLNKFFGTTVVQHKSGLLSISSSKAEPYRTIHFDPVTPPGKGKSEARAFSFEAIQNKDADGGAAFEVVARVNGQTFKLLGFSSEQDAKSCVYAIENAYFKPVARSVRAFYRFVVFLVAVFVVLTVVDVVAEGHARNKEKLAAADQTQTMQQLDGRALDMPPPQPMPTPPSQPLSQPMPQAVGQTGDAATAPQAQPQEQKVPTSPGDAVLDALRGQSR